MSDTTLTPDEAAQRARDLIERDVNARVEAVRHVVAATAEAEQTEQRWRDAQSAHESAWRAALSAGWSEKDLRATGARAPGQAPRQRRSRSTSTRPATDASSTPTE